MAQSPSENARILVVEDEMLIALATVARLERLGYLAEHARNADAAVLRGADRSPGYKIDAALMDIDLGEGPDGISVAATFVDEYGIPVVYLTGQNDEETVDRAFSASSFGFLPKSCGDQVLDTALRTALELGPKILSPRRADEHYLKTELYDLVQRDRSIFEFLQAGSLDGIWYWDLSDPEHEWMSPRFWEIFGYSPEEKRHLASEWQDMIDPRDLETALENFHRHCEDPSHPYDQVVRYRHKDGSTVWVRCRGVAVRDEDGRPIRFLGAHNELTEFKEAELRNRRLAEDLSRSLTEMNHRVKNNLAILRSLISVEMMQEDKTKDAALRDITARIHGIELLHERLYATQNVDRVELLPYLHDIWGQLLANTGDQKNTGVPIVVEPQDLTVSPRFSTHLGVILIELLTNSVKARDHATHGPTPQLTVRAGASQVSFEYQDGGPAPPGVSKLSDFKFGTGLTLIQGMVDAMGGKISLQTEDSLVFDVSIPVEAGEILVTANP